MRDIKKKNLEIKGKYIKNAFTTNLNFNELVIKKELWIKKLQRMTALGMRQKVAGIQRHWPSKPDPRQTTAVLLALSKPAQED